MVGKTFRFPPSSYFRGKHHEAASQNETESKINYLKLKYEKYFHGKILP